MTADADNTLLGNLSSIASVDRGLAERIAWPCSSEHVGRADDGRWMYRIHRTWHTLSVDDAVVDALLADYDPLKPVLLVGLGAGEVLAEVLRRSPSAAVWAFERDPWLLRTTMSHTIWGRHIREGTLRFLLTTDIVDLIEDVGVPEQVIRHPFLSGVYRLEEALLRDGVGERKALMALGGLFVDDVADALRNEGLTPLPWDQRGWSAEELERSVRITGAEVAVSINYVHGLAEACADYGVPLRVWEIDPSTDDLAPLQDANRVGANVRVGTWRQAHVEVFADAGFPDVVHLPLAANPERRHPVELTTEEAAKYEADVVFVGASMVGQGLAFRRKLIAAHMLARGGDPTKAVEEAEEAIDAVLSAQRDDFSVYRVPELLAEALPTLAGDIMNPAVQQALDGARPDALLGEMAAADKRITYVANLGQVAIHVWGDEGWMHAEEYGVVVRGPAGHGPELTKIYSRPAIHLDIGRIYQSDIVTMRVFDVLACGGFCLAEWSPELEDLFEVGVELDCYRTLEEMLEKAGHWLEQGPEARAEVGRRGRERILKDHTIRQRVQRLLAL